MAVLIVKNIVTEGPGTIEDFLKKEGIPFRIVELGSGEVPPPLDGFDTLIVLGGPMGVYEIERHPHLMTGSRLIREAINRDMKVLGTCLGSQLIAHCLGAKVYPGPEKEIGWHHVELTGEGLKDACMRKLATHPAVGDFWRKFQVFHWHGDTFDLPLQAILLACSAKYRHQAFRFGDKVYALQFHMEVSRKMIGEWFQGTPELEKMISETDEIYEEYRGRAANFYKAFFGELMTRTRED